MKSTNPEGRAFTMEDFEKGLMLAGYILPRSASDLADKAALAAYDKEQKKESKNIHFKRVVLAAEIAFQLHSEPTFGRIKFQKLVYLCEHAADMNLQKRYAKQAAGPFDNKFMHSIEKDFKVNQWFEVDKVNDGKMNRSKYKAMQKSENYKPYFDKYFGEQRGAIQYVIDLFRGVKTDTAEIAATLYACYLELKSSGHAWTIEDLLTKFYDWSEKKGRFAETTVKGVWQWMIDKKLILPT